MCSVIYIPNQQFQCIYFNFDEAKASFMSAVQAVCFSFCRNILIK